MRRARPLAEVWLDVPVHHMTALDDLLPATPTCWADGRTSDQADQRAITLMMTAVRDLLENHRGGCDEYSLHAAATIRALPK